MIHPILLFDGVCNFCDASVNFIIKRDASKQFRFAAIQSDTGQKLLKKFGLSVTDLNTMVLVVGGRYYIKSAAALQITKRMPGLWPVLFILIIVPPFVRNCAYDIIATHRYRWFGKKESCLVPTPELKERFLE